MKNRNELKLAQLLMTLAILLIGCAIRTTSAQPVPEITEKAFAATVSLEMSDDNGDILYGSGFFVTPDRIATNYQVVAGAVNGTAKVVGKETTYTIEGFTAIDRDTDLAILKVSVVGVKPLPLGDSDAVKVNETVYMASKAVYVADNLSEGEGTFSEGSVNSLGDGNVKNRLEIHVPLFQRAAPRAPGSGGPVLNTRGEVIGVFVDPRGDNSPIIFPNFLSYVAIPSNFLKSLIAQTESAKPSWDHQSVSAATYYLRGNALRDLELYDAAIEAYTQALRLEPNHAEAYNNRGAMKAALGDHFEAILDYDAALQINPDAVRAYYNRGNVLVKLGDPVGALRDYDEAIRINPDYVLAYLNRGILKAAIGDPAAAIRDWDAAIRIDPDFAGAYYSRGLEKARLGDLAAALQDYDAAIRIDPDFADAYVNRGNVKDSLGDYAGALHDYDAAIRIDPDFAKAYVNRGGMKGKLGDLAGAISDYDAAIRLTPEDAKAYVNRGLTKADLGRIEEAKQDFRTAVRLAEQSGDTAAKALAEEMLRRLQ